MVVVGLLAGAGGLSACSGANTPAVSDDADAGSTVTVGTKDAGGGGGGTPVDAGSGGSKDAGRGGGGADSGPVSTSTHPATTPPTKTCAYKPDSDGFFDLLSPQGSYTVRLPAGYDKTRPYPVVIGTHGCDDSADNFDTWGPAAYNDDASERENDKLSYIALSVEDQSGQCWSLDDSGKVLAALDDAAACFYVDQSRVTMVGYSSGAAVAYKVGLGNAQRFNGILIEDGALYDNGSAETSLLANAAWKINIAHLTHEGDGDYPKDQVEADWKVIVAAGFPLQTRVTSAPSHDGSSTDWYSWLEPHITAWIAP